MVGEGHLGCQGLTSPLQWEVVRLEWVGAMDMSLSKVWELVMDREAWLAVIHVITKSQTQLRQ